MDFLNIPARLRRRTKPPSMSHPGSATGFAGHPCPTISVLMTEYQENLIRLRKGGVQSLGWSASLAFAIIVSDNNYKNRRQFQKYNLVIASDYNVDLDILYFPFSLNESHYHIILTQPLPQQFLIRIEHFQFYVFV